jgi:hypothetical protein
MKTGQRMLPAPSATKHRDRRIRGEIRRTIVSVSYNRIRDESLADEAMKRSIAKEFPDVETKPHVVFNTPAAEKILRRREADKQAVRKIEWQNI